MSQTVRNDNYDWAVLDDLGRLLGYLDHKGEPYLIAKAVYDGSGNLIGLRNSDGSVAALAGSGDVTQTGIQTLTNKTLVTPTIIGAIAGLSAISVGLGNVDNTSDQDKPVSDDTQLALNGKQDLLISGVTIKTMNGLSFLGSGDVPVGGAVLQAGALVSDSTKAPNAQAVSQAVGGKADTSTVSDLQTSVNVANTSISTIVSDVASLQIEVDGKMDRLDAVDLTGSLTLTHDAHSNRDLSWTGALPATLTMGTVEHGDAYFGANNGTALLTFAGVVVPEGMKATCDPGETFLIYVSGGHSISQIPSDSASSVPAPVSITGAAEAGSTLTASLAGGWQAESFQWQRDDGSGYADLSGATANTRVVDPADVGNPLRVKAIGLSYLSDSVTAPNLGIFEDDFTGDGEDLNGRVPDTSNVEGVTWSQGSGGVALTGDGTLTLQSGGHSVWVHPITSRKNFRLAVTAAFFEEGAAMRVLLRLQDEENYYAVQVGTTYVLAFTAVDGVGGTAIFNVPTTEFASGGEHTVEIIMASDDTFTVKINGNTIAGATGTLTGANWNVGVQNPSGYDIYVTHILAGA